MQPANRYADRMQAGQVLADHLQPFAGRDDTIVLALPRGGVPVAAAIARSLQLPLDVFLVRKLGAPENPERALGALAEGGMPVMDRDLVDELELTPAQIDVATARAEMELAEQEAVFAPHRAQVDVKGRRVILVDDGIATGWTLRAALLALREREPLQLTVAAPVGPRATCAALDELADQIVCPLQPEPFHAVGLWYAHFAPLTDAEVCATLEDSLHPRAGSGPSARR